MIFKTAITDNSFIAVTFVRTNMRQLTHRKEVRLTQQESHYLDVLSNVYNINCSQFIRQAIIEKLQRDIKSIRNKHNLKEDCPF